MSKKIFYVEAHGGHTNEVIAGELPTENAKPVLCIDGVKRPLWLCDYRFIEKLKKNRKSGQLAFKVWYREGQYGPVREWPFLDKKKPTLASALKKGVVKKLSAAV